jgi:hypothetical protein
VTTAATTVDSTTHTPDAHATPHAPQLGSDVGSTHVPLQQMPLNGPVDLRHDAPSGLPAHSERTQKPTIAPAV